MCQNSPILLLVFTLVLSCLVDWMIELSISNKEQTRHIGNFTLHSFNTPSGREWNGLPWVQTWTQVNTFGISLGVLYVLVTNTTTMADLQRLLVEEWNAIPQQCVTRLVTSMRRWCQAVVAAYGSSTRSWGSWGCIKWIKCKIANMSCLFLVTDREFNHPIHQTKSKDSYQIRVNTNRRIGEFWHILLGRYPHTQLCCSSHKCMFLTNVAPFKREINRLSNDIL